MHHGAVEQTKGKEIREWSHRRLTPGHESRILYSISAKRQKKRGIVVLPYQGPQVEQGDPTGAKPLCTLRERRPYAAVRAIHASFHIARIALPIVRTILELAN